MKLLASVRRYRLDVSRFAANKLIPLRRAITAIGIGLLPFGIVSSRWRRARNKSAVGGLERRKTSLCPELALTVFSYAREGIIIADSAGQIVRVNEAFTRITGYGPSELLGQSLHSQGMVSQVSTFYESMKAALACHGHWSGNIWSSRKDGPELSLQLSISVVHDSNGEVSHYVALISDITQLKKRQQQLERNAHYDALTQLPNRLLLAERMRQAMSRARSHHHNLAIAFIDLDGFKRVNDEHGHDLGDRVLRILAQRIKSTIREGDTLARLGGDEFVAGLVGLQQPQDCGPVLERMLVAASAPILVDGRIVQVSASIGVSFFPQHGQEIEGLIRKADHAMYLSKRAGGSRLAFCAG